MPLANPAAGVLAVLSVYGPITETDLSARIEDVGDPLADLARAGRVEQRGGCWRIAPEAPAS